MWLFISGRFDVFFSVKEFEAGGLRSIDAKNFGRVVKKCLDLPKTVRQCDIPLYILFSVRLTHLCSLCLICLQLETSRCNYLLNLH